MNRRVADQNPGFALLVEVYAVGLNDSLHKGLGRPMALRMGDDLRARLSRAACKRGLEAQQLVREILDRCLPPPE